MSNGGFEATHVAPADGLQAWDAPDPTRPPVAEVQPGVVMQVMEQRGAWAHVLFSNGWMGWVDGRRMVEVAPPAAARTPAPTPAPVSMPRPAATPVAATEEPKWSPAVTDEPTLSASPLPAPSPWTVAEPSPSPGSWDARVHEDDEPSLFADEPAFSPSQPATSLDTGTGEVESPDTPASPRPRPQRRARPVGPGPSSGGRGLAGALGPLKISPAPIGAVVIFLGALLPWIRMSGFHGNAFRVPIAFLYDYKTQGGGLKVGLLLVAASVVSGAFCVLPGQVKVRRIIGAVVVAVALLYTIELERVLSNAGKGAPGLTSVVGLGVLVAAAAGVALIVDKTEPAQR